MYLPGAVVLALGALRAESQITDAFRTGAGMAGTSTTTTCRSAARCSSGPATWLTWPSWIPAVRRLGLHEGSIELARWRAAQAGVTDRTTFEVASGGGADRRPAERTGLAGLTAAHPTVIGAGITAPKPLISTSTVVTSAAGAW